MFDPYRKWLGIPEGQRPPTHYQLLGISPDEQDREVINAAVVRQSAFVRNFQTGQHSAEATRLLNEIAAAKVCLFDPSKRAAYDRQLRPASRPAAGQPPDQAAGLRPSSMLQPPPTRPAAPARPPAPTPGPPRTSSPAPLGDPAVVRPRPPAPAPLVSIPATTWHAADEPGLQYTLPSLAAPDRRGPPVWMWFLPIGFGVTALAVLAALVFSRKPSGGSVAQLGHSTVVPATAGGPFVDPSTPRSAPIPPAPAMREPSLHVEPPQISETPAAPPPSPAASASHAVTMPIAASEGPGAEASFYGDSAGWSDGSTLAIPVSRSEPVVFARAGGPFVAVGPTVYDLTSGEAVGKAGPNENEFDWQTRRALSDDGKYFATGRKGVVEVRRCQDGERVCSLEGAWEADRLEFLDFGGPGQLITCARHGADEYLELWNISTGKLLKKFTVDSVGRNTALTNDGRYWAVELHLKGILVYDIQKSPSKGKGKISARIPVPALEGRFLDIDGFRFSPGSEELAAVCDDGARVLCWSKKTDLVFEHSLGTNLRSFWTGSPGYRGQMVEWHPAGRGWLLNGHTFLDRKTARVTWLLKTDNSSTASHRFIDDDRLIALRDTNSQRELVDVKIPWQKIDDSLAAMQDAARPAWIGPAQPVALRVQVSQVGDGAAQQVASDLRQLLAQRLAADKIELADDAPATLVVDYSESYQAGRTVAPPNMPGMRVNIPPHQIPGSTHGKIELRLEATEGGKTLWTGSLSVFASDNSGGSPRLAINSALAARLRGSLLPYFLPKEKELVPLPAVIVP